MPVEDAGELLASTVRHAVEYAPFYGKLYEGHDLLSIDAHNFRELPTVKKSDLANAGVDALAVRKMPPYVNLTGGTKGGPKTFLRFTGAEERAAFEKIHRALAAPKSDTVPLTVRIVSLHHGLPLVEPVEGILTLPLERPSHLRLLRDVLRNEYAFEGVSARVQAVYGALPQLMALTYGCLEAGDQISTLGITQLLSSSFVLYSGVKRALREAWSAHVYDLYGVSEVPGFYAQECPSCGFLHFSHLAYVELLEPDGNEFVETGFARVVVTAYLPLARTQPMIRYETGDIVLIEGTCGLENLPCVRFVGRLSDVVAQKINGRYQLLLAPAQVIEAIGDIADIAQRRTHIDDNLRLATATGGPRFEVRAVRDDAGQISRIQLIVETYWSPLRFRLRSQELAAEIRERVLARSAILADAVNCGCVSFGVNTVQAGSLGEAVGY